MRDLGCLGCHAIAGEGGAVGPALDRKGIEDDASAQGLSLNAYSRESVLDPNAYLVQGFPAQIMPRGLWRKDDRLGDGEPGEILGRVG